MLVRSVAGLATNVQCTIVAMASASLAEEAACTLAGQQLRAFSAIVGAFVADAASTPTHWCYDSQKLAADLAGSPAAFASPPLNPFYRLPPGSSTSYGEQLLIALRSLVEHGGRQDRTDIGRRTAEAMGTATEYGPLNRTTQEFGTGKMELPLDGPWRQGSVLHFLERLQEGGGYLDSGGEDDQAECFIKTLPLVAAGAGQPQLLELVEDAIRITQDNDAAVAYGVTAARLLSAVVLGNRCAAAARSMPAMLRERSRDNPQPDDRYVAKRLNDVITMAEGGEVEASYLECVATYCRSYDMATYRRHDGVEVKAGVFTPLN